MDWLGLAREHAYRLWAWQTDEAIIVSSRTTRAWRATVTVGDGIEERVNVVEINRETGDEIHPEPESYQWQPTVFQKDFEQGRIHPAD